MSQEKTFKVYTVQNRMAVPDLDMSQPRYHTVVGTCVRIQGHELTYVLDFRGD